MNKYAFISTAAMLLLVASTAADTIYPGGSDHRTAYIINTATLAVSDTLTIERYIVVGEITDVDHLYFSDQLPQEFYVVGYELKINGVPAPHLYEDSLPNITLEGFDTYQWVVNSPDPSDSIMEPIAPGDSISLSVHLVCDHAGQYQLPLHTTVFSGPLSSYFATGAPLAVSVGNCCNGLTGNVDCDPLDVVDIGDVTRLIDYLFISNAPLCCKEEGDVIDDDGTGNVDIADLTRLIDYLFISRNALRNCP